jgi:phage-related protein
LADYVIIYRLDDGDVLIVIVRVFVKKTQKTPSREIDLALSRAKEVLP